MDFSKNSFKKVIGKTLKKCIISIIFCDFWYAYFFIMQFCCCHTSNLNYLPHWDTELIFLFLFIGFHTSKWRTYPLFLKSTFKLIWNPNILNLLIVYPLCHWHWLSTLNCDYLYDFSTNFEMRRWNIRSPEEVHSWKKSSQKSCDTVPLDDNFRIAVSFFTVSTASKNSVIEPVSPYCYRGRWGNCVLM